jgi:hypothetical protein
MTTEIAPSTRFEAWVRQLRVSWMGVAAQRIFGGFAAVLGDKSVDWIKQGLLEHMPAHASDPGVALIASERQMDTYPGEPAADLAAREPYQRWIMRFAGSQIGVLIGLHFAGFDDAVLVTQNGLAFQLTLPLPPFEENWDPRANIVVTELSSLSVAMQSYKTLWRSVPADTPWWTFDSDSDQCSRFAVLFPGPRLPSWFLTWGVATFDGTEDGSPSNPWPLVTWNNEFPDTTYQIQPGAPTITSGGPAAVYADDSTKTTRDVRIAATAAFVGTVDVLAWQLGANPYADLHPGDLARLKSTIRKWRPVRAQCRGVYALVYGNFVGWPPRTVGNAPPAPGSVAAFTGGF